MNPGGEPERDDTGLPPVDIEIPDDARDLDRDVQAYRRELRALRRSERHRRWHGSLSKDGVVLPLLACCLILALITGTLLTVFTATSNSGRGNSPGSGAAGTPTISGATAATMVRGQQPPDATIDLDGSAVPVQQLDEAMLVLVPSGCGCPQAFRWLAEVASKASVPAYVVYTAATKQEASRLYYGLDSQLRTVHGPVLLVRETDSENLLGAASFPAAIPHDQLAAVLVGSGQLATWVSHLSPSDNQAPILQVLKNL